MCTKTCFLPSLTLIMMLWETSKAYEKLSNSSQLQCKFQTKHCSITMIKFERKQDTIQSYNGIDRPAEQVAKQKQLLLPVQGKYFVFIILALISVSFLNLHPYELLYELLFIFQHVHHRGTCSSVIINVQNPGPNDYLFILYHRY